MKAIEILEYELKRTRNIDQSLPVQIVELLIKHRDEIEWGLKVLKMAMGRAGETITLPKE